MKKITEIKLEAITPFGWGDITEGFLKKYSRKVGAISTDEMVDDPIYYIDNRMLENIATGPITDDGPDAWAKTNAVDVLKTLVIFKQSPNFKMYFLIR